MKALSLTQPWAMLVAIGAKRIETRSWGTSYRGPLAIHAAKGFPKWAREFTLEPACYEAVKARYTARMVVEHAKGYPAYPLGCVLATCRLVDCIPTSIGIHGTANGVQGVVLPGIGFIHGKELEFGDFADGRYAWILEDVKPLREPIPARGSLGLWKWVEAA